MRITIVGTGYQGLVVGTCLAENGHQVVCVDRDASRVQDLRRAHIPIYEAGLEELVARNLEEERLAFTTDLTEAVGDCLMVFLCIGTIANEEGEPDNTSLFQAMEDIARAMNGYRIIVNKSTCPPGTADELRNILTLNTSHPFDIVVNPDFLKEGTAVDDFMRPDRVVIGCEDVRVREIMKELYVPFLRTGRPFLSMGLRSAEMTKYATNVMLATRISLMNQLADICSHYGADISEVREGVGADCRIGATFLFPGIGFGGVGLPKDVACCAKLAQKHGLQSDLIDAVIAVNQRRREQFLNNIFDYYDNALQGKHLAIWGVSFKPRTDDIRGAPAVYLIDRLLQAGASVAVFDPTAATKLRERYGDAITIASKYYAALENADGLAIVTEWNEFRRPDYDRMAQLMREKVIFDGRNLYTPKVMKEHGFRYISIGRPPV